jgi:hypothetical protein
LCVFNLKNIKIFFTGKKAEKILAPKRVIFTCFEYFTLPNYGAAGAKCRLGIFVIKKKPTG